MPAFDYQASQSLVPTVADGLARWIFRSALRNIAFAAATLVAVLCCLTPTPARAAISCSFGNGGALFGTINTTSGLDYNSTLVITAGCAGGTSGTQMYLCTQITGATGGYGSSNGPFYLLKGSNQLNMYIYKDAARTQPFTIGSWVITPFTIDASGQGYPSYTPYLRIPGGQTSAPSGSYSTNVSVFVKVGVAATLGSDCSGASVNSVSQNLFATANNAATCTVGGSTLSFGSVSFLSGNIDASTSIALTCTNGSSWSLSLDGGQHGGTTATNRNMVNGSNSVTYGLFSDAARTLGIYGSSGVSGTGTGSSQAIGIYGRVAPQTTPPAGTYTDTVVISVTY